MAALLQHGIKRNWGASCHAVQANDGSWYYLFQDRNGALARVVHVLLDGTQKPLDMRNLTTRPGLAFFNDGRIGATAGKDGDDDTLPEIIPIPDLFRQFAPGLTGPRGPQGPAGPQGPQGPKGEPGSGTLSERYTAALNRLCQFLGI